MSGPRANGSRRRRRSAIPKRSKICRGCRGNKNNVCGRFRTGITFEGSRQRRRTRSLLMRVFVLLAALPLAAPAHAGDDVAAAQSVIRSQAEALGRDDATSAYSYAAPAIQGMFPRADIFLNMVRR